MERWQWRKWNLFVVPLGAALGASACSTADSSSVEPLGRTQLALSCGPGGAGLPAPPPGDPPPAQYPWSVVDIGAPPAGTDCYYASENRFEVQGFGKGVPRLANGDGAGHLEPDQTRFVHKKISGDFEITARVTFLDGISGEDKARVGVVARQDLTPTSPMAAALYTLGACVGPDCGAAARSEFNPSFRTSPTMAPFDVNLSTVTTLYPPQPVQNPAPPGTQVRSIWLRLQRIGNDFSVARKAEGSLYWLPLVEQSGGVFTSQTAYVGLVVSGGVTVNGGSLTVNSALATFDQVYVGPPRLDHKTSWVGETYEQASTGYIEQTLHSLYVAPNVAVTGGRRFYTYGGSLDQSQNLGAYDDDGKPLAKTSAYQELCDPRDTGCPPNLDGEGYPPKQGALAGDGANLYVVVPKSNTQSGGFCVQRRSPDLAFITTSSNHCAAASALGKVGGIAVRGGPLFVSQPDSNSVVLLNASTLDLGSPGEFPVDLRPGPMAVDLRGNLWVIHARAPFPIPGSYDELPNVLATIKCYSPTGSACGAITGIANPTAIAADPSQDRLIIANNAKGAETVLACGSLTGTPSCTALIAQSGSIYAGDRGRVYDADDGGYARFYGLTGVGVDGSGVPYVAMGGVNGLGADIRKFLPSQGTPKLTQGLLNFVNGIAFDPLAGGTNAYSVRYRISLDLQKTLPGSEWKLDALTWDPATGEKDEHGANARSSGAVGVRWIGGQRFLLTGAEDADPDPNDEHLAPQRLTLYRFAGDIAIPAVSIRAQIKCAKKASDCSSINNTSCSCNIDRAHDGSVDAYGVLSLWVDANGDGREDPSEIDSTFDPVLGNNSDPGCCHDPNDPAHCPANSSPCVVSEQGGVVTSGQLSKPPFPELGLLGIEVTPDNALWLSFGKDLAAYQALNIHQAIWKLAPVNAAQPLNNYGVPVYSLAWGSYRTGMAPPPGFTDTVGALRYVGNSMYVAGGQGDVRTLSRYDNWTGTPTLAYSPIDPYALYANGSVNVWFSPEKFTGSYRKFFSFDVAGDKIFIAQRMGPVYVYDANTGAPQQALTPGPESSGLNAWNDAGVLSATQTATGEYLVLAGDQIAHSRAHLYRFAGSAPPPPPPPAACYPNAPFNPPVPAFTGSTSADGLTFSADGNTAYVSRKASTNYEIYRVTRDANGIFDMSTAVAPVGPVNSAVDERAPSVSADGLRVYFVRFLGNGNLGVGNYNPSTQQFSSLEWLAAINSNYHDQDPFYLAQFQPNPLLFYASEKATSGSNRDLYAVTHSMSNNTYVNDTYLTGPNSPNDEDYRPVVTPDALTLFFASSRNGLGGDSDGEIFVSTRANTSSNFGAAALLPSFSSSGIEFPVTVSPDGCTLYFASNRDTGLGNTQVFRLFQATRASSLLTQVTLTLNLVNNGSVTGGGFNCFRNNGTTSGICTAVGAPNALLTLWASSAASWSGSCAGNNGNPSTDGVAVFTNGGVCTVTL